MKGRCVGVFDSGIGGLSVLHACLHAAPGHCYLYYGDNGHAPYGALPAERVRKLVWRGVRELTAAGAEVIVLACNTATALCAEQLRERLSIPVLGIEPCVLPASRRCGNVLVLATPHTAGSRRLQWLIQSAAPCRFTVAPLRHLAGEIEAFARGGGAPDLSALPRGEYDGVVLGCTHYALIAPLLHELYRAPLFDGAEGVARRLVTTLRHLPPSSPAILGKTGEGGRRAMGFLGTADHHGDLFDTNICLLYHPENNTNSEIIFLNSTGSINKITYKQMFLS